MIDLEIKNLNLKISEKALLKLIKENKNFLDDKVTFSRTKYEKFFYQIILMHQILKIN